MNPKHAMPLCRKLSAMTNTELEQRFPNLWEHYLAPGIGDFRDEAVISLSGLVDIISLFEPGPPAASYKQAVYAELVKFMDEEGITAT